MNEYCIFLEEQKWVEFFLDEMDTEQANEKTKERFWPLAMQLAGKMSFVASCEKKTENKEICQSHIIQAIRSFVESSVQFRVSITGKDLK